MLREILDAALASLPKQSCAFGGGANVHAAAVHGIASDLDHPAALESGDNAAHGGRLDLLGGGEIAKRFGSGKHQHRQGRELRRADSGSSVLLADSAKQVDGGGMKPVGGCDRIGAA